MFQHSDSVLAIGPALLTVQREVEVVKKDSENPHFRSSYASLEAVLETIKTKLNTAGVVIIQTPVATSDAGVLGLTTTLLHAASGEWIAGTATIPLSKNDPQAYGSALTYGRRYSLCALLSLATEDDDAESATSHRAPTGRPQGDIARKDGPRPSLLGKGKKTEDAPAEEPKPKRTFGKKKEEAPAQEQPAERPAAKTTVPRPKVGGGALFKKNDSEGEKEGGSGEGK